MGFKKKEITYENARLYFCFREKGFTDNRAIPMANRLRCSSNTLEKRATLYQNCQKKVIAQALDKRTSECVNKTKKVHVERMYTQYVVKYDEKRKDIPENINSIYINEITGRASTTPISPKKGGLTTFYRATSPALKNNPTYRLLSGSQTAKLTKEREIDVDPPWGNVVRSPKMLKANEGSRANEIGQSKGGEKAKTGSRMEILVEDQRRNDEHVENVAFLLTHQIIVTK